jgi:2'-5' RNA ligase
VRINHDVSQIGGKITSFEYDEAKKQIRGSAEPKDEAVWDQLRRGILTSFSQSGTYAYRRCKACKADILGRGNYCAACKADVVVQYAVGELIEISFCDIGALQTALILHIKADGSQELRKIAPKTPESVIDAAKLEADRAAASFAAAAKRTPQAPDGKFTPRSSGPVHECLTAAGYEHKRTGSSTDGNETVPTTSYEHASGASVIVRGEDSWEHNDGHGRTRTGSGVEDLKAHLDACHAKAAGSGVREIRDFLKSAYTRENAEQSLAKAGFSILERSETYDSFRFVVKHSAGCVMVPIPPDSEAGKNMAELRSKIAPEHLMGQGLEEEPHITLRYGFTDGMDAIGQYVAQQNPFLVTFGGTAAFEPSEHSDNAAPLHVKVVSDDLKRMNSEIAKVGTWKESNFDYNPHATLGYVDPDVVYSYVNFDDMEGMSFTADRILLSPAEGTRTTIDLHREGDKAMAFEQFTLTEISGIKRVFGEAPDVFVKRATTEIMSKTSSTVTITMSGPDKDGNYSYVDNFGKAVQVSDNLARFINKAEKKTKRVAGEDLPASAFLIVLDPDDTSTWNLPVKFSTEAKCKSHIRNALARFDELKDVPQDVKDAAWKKLVALAKKHGIEVDEDTDKAVIAYQIHKAEIDLAKSMYDVADLSQLLQAIKWIELRQIFEGEYEDDDENLTIAGRLRAWLADGVDILKTMVDEETAELVSEPALKAALLNKGAESMKKFDELLKGVQGFSGHFKAAHGHHEAKAAHHMKCAAAHGEACETHKAAGAEHHKMAAHMAADKVHAGHHKTMGDHHMKMASHHTDKAAHHTAMHKTHQAMCENCKAMCDHLEGTGKAFKAAAALEPDTPQANEAMTKAMESFTATMAKMEDLLKAQTPEATAAAVAKAVKAELAAQPEPTRATVIPIARPGEPVNKAAGPVGDDDSYDNSGGLRRGLAAAISK